MRAALILIQAGILTLIAVIGAHGSSDDAAVCPLPAGKFELHCDT